jgi:hypothetical protein
MGKTEAHHRWDKRASRPKWRQSMVYRRAMLCSALRAAREVGRLDWETVPLVILSGRVLKMNAAIDKVWPMVIDDTGSLWE